MENEPSKERAFKLFLKIENIPMKLKVKEMSGIEVLISSVEGDYASGSEDDMTKKRNLNSNTVNDTDNNNALSSKEVNDTDNSKLLSPKEVNDTDNNNLLSLKEVNDTDNNNLLSPKEVNDTDNNNLLSPKEVNDTDNALSPKEVLMVNLLRSPFLDRDVADYFISIYQGQFIAHDKLLYKFHNHYWKLIDWTLIYNLLDAEYASLEEFIDTKYPNKNKYCSDFRKKCLNHLKRLGRDGSLKTIINNITNKISRDKYETIWDTQPYLLGFQNGVYDLEHDLFRSGRPEDYITKVLPFEFQNTAEEEIVWFMKFLDQIMPVEEERDFLLKVLSTGLDGKLLGNIIFLLGNGR